MWKAIALSFGLAMDATAVSAARGLAGRNRRELVILPLVFGGFQSGMSALGWAGGAWAGELFARWNGPVAFGLLLLIGGKMIFDAWRGGDEGEHAPGVVDGAQSAPSTSLLTRGGVYLGLGIATSIDAAAAGLTLPLLPVEPWVSVVLIGAITAACSVVGYLAGRALGGRLGPRLGVLGGLVLIAIGTDMLIRTL
jgi:putative Mn2+ efflux pump MntP